MANSRPQQDSPLNEQEMAPLAMAREDAGRAQFANDEERKMYLEDDSSAAEGVDSAAKSWDGFAGEIDL